ncbi:hypothetical protein DERP_011099 [Dermatophagoides pteronyssinus]|uniref:Uncharacterized protein n=1 Tax=Dermatophagoides pteronyssinus TaxID=6956 RepID=A0ABQ8J8V3_DERPT|nr:hypothetical protein DERP_011099 [Dermatophagoides pteronyssinus]
MYLYYRSLNRQLIFHKIVPSVKRATPFEQSSSTKRSTSSGINYYRFPSSFVSKKRGLTGGNVFVDDQQQGFDEIRNLLVISLISLIQSISKSYDDDNDSLGFS